MRFLFLIPILVMPLGAQLRITEAMSDSKHSNPDDVGGDWFEITNTGNTAVNVANYSFDDDDAQAGASGGFPSYSLPAGASMIVLDDDSSATFRTVWNLPASVRIITDSEIDNFQGLGKNGDAVFLFNSGGTAIDMFGFGAATEGVSFARFSNGDPVPGNLSVDGLFGAYESGDTTEDLGSPGIAPSLPDPLPPFFNAPFTTAGLANSSLSVSEYRINSIDPNSDDTITLSSSGTPSWLTVNDLGEGIAQLSGTPPPSAIGPHEFQITATDNTDRATNQTYRIDVLAATSPIILNEYNAVSSGEFLDGGDQDDEGAPSDPVLGRIEGNGGAWVEFVVTETADLRGWTLKIENETRERILKFSDHIALSEITAGTILTFTNSQATSPTWLNRTTGTYTWSNIWMHDSILIDQENSTHPATPAIDSNDTRFTWSNSIDEIIYGASGESIALKDENENGTGETPVAVSDTEVFQLERNPASSATPLDLNYDDGGTSTFGRPNKWDDNTMTQSFAGLVSGNPPLTVGPISQTKAVGGTFNLEVTIERAISISEIELPDFITATFESEKVTFMNNRPLTEADLGFHEVTISAYETTQMNPLAYLVFELEVLNPNPALVLNEYNAVAPDRFLNGGSAAADEDGAPASTDTHFGRIVGNGGNWFELAVRGDGSNGFTNLTGWTIEVGKVAPSGKFAPATTTITLSDPNTWSAIANGTLLTFIDKDTSDGGLDTEFNRVNLLTTDGYAWSNVFLGSPGIITTTNLANLAIDSDNTAFQIKDSSGTIVFGPSGEGIAPLSGVGSTEIFELENDPALSLSPIDEAFDDGSSGSTFGSPNLFAPAGTEEDRAQDFSPFVQSLLQAYFANLGIPGADPSADNDNDNHSNLSEYLLGGNPADGAIFPQTDFDPTTNTAAINIRVNDPNYTLVTQRSPDLINWVTTELETSDEASPLGLDFLLRNFTYTGNEGKMFFRVSPQP